MHNAPKLPLRFFRWFCQPKLLKHIEGDLMELYHERVKTFGKRKADARFIVDVLLLFRPGIIRPIEAHRNSNNYGMYKSYLKIGWRNLVKDKGYSMINIGGFALGIAVSMFIGLWIHDEVAFDRYHKNYESVAQVMQHANVGGQFETWYSTPGIMSSELRSRYGNDFKYVVQASWIGTHMLTVEGNSFVQEGIFFEPDAPEMLSLHMLNGTRAGLKDKYSILLSSSVARSLFDSEDPINKTIRFDRLWDVKVTGVYEDLPPNTTFGNVKIIMPWELWLEQNPWTRNMANPWESNFSQTLVQIAENADMSAISEKIKNIKLDNVNTEAQKYRWEVFLHPMSKWNLYSEFRNKENVGGNIRYVQLFALIGVFVLLLACINFMNLATARSERRAKEVGIRKTIGSRRGQLVFQFFSESYLVVALSFLFSLLIVMLMLPIFNDVAGKQVEIQIQDPQFWFFSMAFIFITGLLSGSYPAFYLSSFKPLKAMKGTVFAGRHASVPRKILVVLQFTVSIIMIIGTIIVFQQIEHAKSRPTGYNKEGLLSLSLQDEIKKHFDVVRTELRNSGAIEEMAACSSPLTAVWNTNGNIEWEGKDPNLVIEFPNNAVSHDFGRTVQWEIKDGRDFSRDFATDSLALIINESAAKVLAFEEPVGKNLRWGPYSWTIIGVVKDVLQESPFFPVRPTVYRVSSYDNMSNLVLRLNPGQDASQSLSAIKNIWKKYTPTVPFGYEFVDEEFGNKFRSEVRLGKLTSSFALLAIIISSLGLFGMASFVAEQRTKEIGIRKVLGASVTNLWGLLSKEFLLMVTLSCAIGSPVAYYFLEKWLAGYDYKITINWTVFALAGGAALIITLSTVSFQAIRAALANPIKSLRSE